jgi:hypothetical protein
MSFVGVSTGVSHLERDASNWQYQATGAAIGFEVHAGVALGNNGRLFATFGYDRSVTFESEYPSYGPTGQSLTTAGLGAGWLHPSGFFFYGVLLVEDAAIFSNTDTEYGSGFGTGFRAGKSFHLMPHWSLDVGLRSEIGRVAYGNGEGGNASTPTVFLLGLTIGATWDGAR